MRRDRSRRRDRGVDLLEVRYEDLTTDLHGQMPRILDYIQVDSNAYDHRRAENKPILGSSTDRGSAEQLHWNPVEKTSEFDPLQRFRHWSRTRHERFNWLAGAEMEQLGYEPIVGRGGQAYNRSLNLILDAQQSTRRLAGKAARRLRALKG